MTKVFQMSELAFFKAYVQKDIPSFATSICEDWISKYNSLLTSIPELPFSNIWVAKHLSSRLPQNSVLHLGIRNSIRSWNYFEVPETVLGYCNTGGFGIDGGVSSLIGASLLHPEKLYFGAFGDLLFFYDMNSLGNREIKSNVRVLIVNNGLGQEFKNYSCFSSMFGDDTNKFIAAQGHYGNKSSVLVKNYAEALGFEYLTASNKDEFLQTAERFVVPQMTDKPIIFEVFTKTEDESKALELVTLISNESKLKRKADDVILNPALKPVREVLKKVLKK